MFMHLNVFIDSSAAMLYLIRMAIRSQRIQLIKLEKHLKEFLKRYRVNSFICRVLWVFLLRAFLAHFLLSCITDGEKCVMSRNMTCPFYRQFLLCLRGTPM